MESHNISKHINVIIIVLILDFLDEVDDTYHVAVATRVRKCC